MRSCPIRLGVLLLVGCTSRPAAVTLPAPDEEAAVRARFAQLQTALKDGDADRLWELLNARSRTDAERAAKDIQAQYARADAAGKRKQEETLGLDEAQLSAMTAKSVFKTKRFRRKYDEVPVSTLEKVALTTDHATVHFAEPDGDHEKTVFVREDGQWQAWLVMPKFKQP